MKKRGALCALLLLACTATVYGDPAEDQYAVAARHYEQGRWEAAASEFQTFLTRFSMDDRAASVRFFLGECFVQLRQYPAAHDVFSKLKTEAQASEYQTQIEFRVGEMAYLMGDVECALPLIDRYTQDHPGDKMCQYALPYLGDMALATGNLELAKASYSEALKKFPDGPLHDECRFGLGRAFEASKETDEALRFYSFLAEFKNKALADDALLRMGVLKYDVGAKEEAIPLLRRIVEEFPESDLRPHAFYWIGMCYSALEQHERAAEVLALASGATQDPSLQPATLFYQAEALRHLGRHDEASAAYDQIIRRWPKTEYVDDAFQTRVQMAFDAHDGVTVDRLVAEFTQLQSESPLLPMAMHLAARSALREEQFEKADSMFSYLIDEVDAPTDGVKGLKPANMYYLALCKLAQQEYADCLDVFDQLDALNGNEEVVTAGVYAARGAAFIGLKKYADAVPYLQQYLEEEPEGPEAARAQSQLVLAFAELGQQDDVTLEHKKLIDTGKSSEFVDSTTLQLAESAFQRKDFAAAEGFFQQLVEHGHSDEAKEQGLSGLAWSQLRQDKHEQATKNFDLFCRQYPDSELSSEAELVVAQTREQSGDLDAALAAYENVVRRYPKSPQHAEALFSAARVCEELERDDRAAELLGRLADEHADFAHLDASLYQRAWLLRDGGRDAEADAVFRQLYESHRASEYWSDAVYRLAEAASAAGEKKEAAGLLQELVTHGKDARVLCYGLYLRGQMATEAKDWDTVIEYMQRVVDEHGSQSLALNAEYWVAESHFRLRHYAEARTRFDALQLKLTDVRREWVAMVPLRRSQLRANAKEWQEAAEIAGGIRETYPEFRQMYEVDYVIGRALTSQAKFSEAREVLTRVVANDLGAKTETAAMAQWMIGETFFHQKKMTDAIRAYHRVEALYEYPVWQALSLLQAGKCHERLQQPVEARRLYAQVLREFADTPAARDAAKRLRVEPRDTVRAAGNRAGNSRHPASKRAPVRDPQGKTAGRMRNPFGVLQEMVSRGAAEVKSDNMKQR